MLTLSFSFSGYAGSAEAAAPLDDDKESIAQVDNFPSSTRTGSIKDKLYETGSNMAFPKSEGLSPMMKVFFVACILLACYLFVRAHSPRRGGGKAGRHGAYEKSLP